MLISMNCLTLKGFTTLRKSLYYIPYFLIFILLWSCGSAKVRKLQKKTTATLDLELFQNHFTGIMVLDPAKRDTILVHNSDKYFTPASNTKIYSLFTGLQLLQEKLPVARYNIQNDTLYLEGTGDPSQLHPYFQDSTLLKFLQSRNETIAIHYNNYTDNKYGPGWAWEDYDGYYSPERNAIPLYGNVLTLNPAASLSVTPPLFKEQVLNKTSPRYRQEKENVFYYENSRTDTLEIPFITGDKLTKQLLDTLLEKPVSLVSHMPSAEKSVLSGISRDSLLIRMMQESDNFLAEQVLIMASAMVSDTLSGRSAISNILENHLPDLAQAPRWVDGSGLSRYNLFTPESIVHVLYKLFQQYPEKELFGYFAAGGVSGTLEDWYPGDPDPYIYAKTGTLGNNHNLSGYLLTRSGKTLIFSFMNNHFRHPNGEIKREMQGLLEWIRDNY